MSDEPLIFLMFAAYDALRRNGWQEPIYAPRNTEIEIIEPGCTAIHRGTRDDEGTFWVHEPGDSYPSHPVLFRRLLQ